MPKASRDRPEQWHRPAQTMNQPPVPGGLIIIMIIIMIMMIIITIIV